MENTTFNKPRPIFALRNLVIFPGMTVPIRVGRAQSIAALRTLRLEAGDREPDGQIIAVLQKPLELKEHISPDELHHVGVLCKIEKIRGNEKDGFQLVLRGLERVMIPHPFEAD